VILCGVFTNRHRAANSSGRTDNPVAEIVPNTQPINLQQPKSFDRSKIAAFDSSVLFACCGTAVPRRQQPPRLQWIGSKGRVRIPSRFRGRRIVEAGFRPSVRPWPLQARVRKRARRRLPGMRPNTFLCALRPGRESPHMPRSTRQCTSDPCSSRSLIRRMLRQSSDGFPSSARKLASLPLETNAPLREIALRVSLGQRLRSASR
jgi:hypothetical protein